MKDRETENHLPYTLEQVTVTARVHPDLTDRSVALVGCINEAALGCEAGNASGRYQRWCACPRRDFLDQPVHIMSFVVEKGSFEVCVVIR